MTVNEVWFRFDQDMDASSFSVADDLLTFQNPSGPLTAGTTIWQDPRTLVITFAPQPIEVPMFMALSPNILNVAGVPLDQDGDRIPGEPGDDQYLANLIVDNAGPFVIHTEPGTTSSVPIDRVAFHFNEPVDATSFSLADVSEFTGPGSVDLRNQLTNFLVEDQTITVFFTEQAAGGQFTISIGPDITDAAGNPMDQSQDGVNGQPDDDFTLATNAQSADLAVTAVTDPVDTTHGNDVTLNWTVQNNGSDPATGTWWDYVYLSTDDTWGLNDTLIAKVLYTGGDLTPNGGNYQGSYTGPLPGILPGDYRVIVRTNILENLTEATQSNNTGVSSASARFDLPVLTSGNVETVNVDFRDELYFEFEVPANMAGGSLVLRLGTSDTSVANELYVSRNALPTPSDHDARSLQGLSSNQYIILSNVQAGTYYLLGAVAPDSQVAPNTPLGTANVQADLLVPGEFNVLDSYFGQGGTVGNRTIVINGVNFDRTITATLTDGSGNSIDASRYYRTSSQKLFVTFDLTSLPAGTYDVVLENSVGQVETVASSMDVVAGGGGEFVPSISAPPAFRRVFHSPFVHFPITVSWSNAGLNDIPVPMVVFTSNEPFNDDFQSNVTGSGWNQSFDGVTADVFFASPSEDYVPGLLLPGQSASKTYQVVPRLASQVQGEAAFYTIDVLYDEPDELFAWSAERDRLDPGRLTEDQFDQLFNDFRNSVGLTVGDYSRMLADMSVVVHDLPTDVFDVTLALTQEAFNRFVAANTASIQGQIEHSQFDIDFTGLEVTATNTDTLAAFSAPVRADGVFSLLEIGEGNYDLTVSGGAVAVSGNQVSVPSDAPTSASVQVAIGGTISGSALNTSGQPVNDVQVTLSSAGLDLALLGDVANDGTFQFTDLLPGTYTLIATAPGRAAIARAVTVDFSESISETLTLVAATRLRGSVQANGAPIADAQIRLENEATGDVLAVFTEDDGSYSFLGVPGGILECNDPAP